MRKYAARSSRLLFSVLFAAACSLFGCSLFEPESHWECNNPDCKSADTGTSNNDAGGDGGMSGRSDGGADAGDAGGQSEGGAGGSSACKTCDADQVCDEQSAECVQCVGNDDCSSAAPVCTIDHHCVACTLDRHCPSSAPACTGENTCVGCTDSAKHCGGKKPICDASHHECVQCLADSDCTDPAASHCSKGACVPCTGSEQCKHLDGVGVCDTSSGSGECVECTGTQYEACGTDSVTSKPLVCDSKARACTTKQAGTAEPCQPCVADAHCRAGTACMQTTFGPSNAETGNFCLWKQDATGNGAPNGDCLNARPYVGTESKWKSVDGDDPKVCKPALTTCQGQNDFRAKSCSGETSQGNAECGAEGVDDAYCAPFGSGFFCTVPCVSYLDCQETRPGDDMECQSQTLGTESIKVCQFQ
jgi:hypothetical protein